jgi:hypothetical protein
MCSYLVLHIDLLIFYLWFDNVFHQYVEKTCRHWVTLMMKCTQTVK